MADDEIKITIRIDPGLHQRLTQAAEHDRRSLNSELMWLIERALDAEDRKARRVRSREASDA
jgi:predicted HicB family RNase H-like nuclease